MTRVLIIGYGNPLRGDDAAGFLAAERLRDLFPALDIEILAVHQLTPELADPISRAGRVVFIDAAATGEPGLIYRRPVAPALDTGTFTHQGTPAALLALTRVLYGEAPRAVLITVAGLDFGFGAPLSAPVKRALETLVSEQIPELIGGK